jgi:hypothetical protein
MVFVPQQRRASGVAHDDLAREGRRLRRQAPRVEFGDRQADGQRASRYRRQRRPVLVFRCVVSKIGANIGGRDGGVHSINPLINTAERMRAKCRG